MLLSYRKCPKLEYCRRLGGIITEYLFAQTIAVKIG